MAADHEVHGPVQLRHDLGDRPGDAGALVHAAGRKAALVDQHHDRLDALGPQLGHQRVHGLGLVLEGQAGNSRGHHDAGRAFQGQADERDGDALELPDIVGRQDRLAGRVVDGAGGEVLEARALEVLRLAAVRIAGRAAAVLQTKQLGDAIVELVIADGTRLQTHQRQALDRGLVVQDAGQERTGADQVAGGDEDRVGSARPELGHQRRHRLGAARRHRDRLAGIGRVRDLDPARGRQKVAVEIVDREDP